MKEPLISFIHNPVKVNIFRIIVFSIIGLVILDQVYSLTKFIYQYSKHYDYGKMLKETCKNSYIEYETERFQLSNNIIDIKINNDNFNNRYNFLILFVSIFVTMFIVFVYTYIFMNSMFNDSMSTLATLVETIGKAQGSKLEIIGNVALKIYDMMGDMFKYGALRNFAIFILFIIRIALILYILLIIPLFIILKFYNNTDISPFIDDKRQFGFLMLNIIFLEIIFVLQFAGNNNISYFTRLIFFCLFILSFFYIFVVVNIYIDINKSNELKNIYENSENKNLKYLSFYRNYKDINQESDVYKSFLTEIFGINKMAFDTSLFKFDIGLPPYIPRDVSDVNMIENILDFNIERIGEYESLSILSKINEYIKLDSFKSIIFFLLILLASIGLIIIIVYLLINFTKWSFLNNIFNDDDSTILYNYAFLPFLLAFMVTIIIVLTKEYNTYINTYMLFKPNSLYKKNLSNINEIFNKILENDKAYVENDSTCKNIVNAIQLVIYSNIFRKDNTAIENIIPEFTYLPECESNDFIDYNKIKAYDFEYTINRKTNIFYSKTKCSSINNDLLINIIKNTSPQELYENVIINKQQSNGINNIQSYSDNFKKQLKFAISNILNQKTYNNLKQLKYTNDYQHNNQLIYIDDNIDSFKKYNQNNYQIQLDKNITLLIDKISDEYFKYIKILFQYNIQFIQSLCGCQKIKDITSEGNTYKDFIEKIESVIKGTGVYEVKSKDYSLNIKKDYIDRFTRTSQIFFTKINKIFSSKLKVSDKNLKLTKYIIKNYNEYQTYISDKYNKNELELIKGGDITINEFKYTDIEKIEKLIKPTLYDNLTKLNEIIKEYSDTDAEIIKNFRNSHNDFKNNINELIRLKDLYIVQFKDKYYTNTSYYIQLIYDYKLEFIEKYINLYTEINNLLAKRELINEEKYNKRKSINEETYNKINDKIINYDTIRKEYEAKYTTIKLMEEDLYKLNVDIRYSQNITTEENKSKKLNELSANTSSIIYIVIICYIILLILTKYIK